MRINRVLSVASRRLRSKSSSEAAAEKEADGQGDKPTEMVNPMMTRAPGDLREVEMQQIAVKDDDAGAAGPDSRVTPVDSDEACGWKAYWDPVNNAHYFHDEKTGETTWETPAGF